MILDFDYSLLDESVAGPFIQCKYCDESNATCSHYSVQYCEFLVQISGYIGKYENQLAIIKSTWMLIHYLMEHKLKPSNLAEMQLINALLIMNPTVPNDYTVFSVWKNWWRYRQFYHCENFLDLVYNMCVENSF